MFLKSLFLSIWFNDYSVIQYPVLFNKSPNNEARNQAKKNLLLDCYWKIYQNGGKLISKDVTEKYNNKMIFFKSNNQLSYIYPYVSSGQTDSKIEENLIRICSSVNKDIIPHLHGYIQIDTMLTDVDLKNHLDTSYNFLKILNHNEPIPLVENHISNKNQDPNYKFDNSKETLVLTQEIFSFMVSFLYFESIYQLVFKKFSQYNLVVDSNKFYSFDERMKHEYSNSVEKLRWQKWKKNFIILNHPNEFVPKDKTVEKTNKINDTFSQRNMNKKKKYQYKHLPNQLSVKEYWIIDQAVDNNWQIIFWHNGDQKSKRITSLTGHSIIADYKCISSKGLVEGSKGERDDYRNCWWIKKLWVHLKFNYQTIIFLIRQM